MSETPSNGHDPDVRHVNNVPWHEAPRPRAERWCWAQTTGWSGLNQIERCACGAARMNRRAWLETNSRIDGPLEPCSAQWHREANMPDDGSIDALRRIWAIKDGKKPSEVR